MCLLDYESARYKEINFFKTLLDNQSSGLSVGNFIHFSEFHYTCQIGIQKLYNKFSADGETGLYYVSNFQLFLLIEKVCNFFKEHVDKIMKILWIFE